MLLLFCVSLVSALELGSLAPGFSLTNLMGESVDLAKPEKERLVLVFFFDASPDSVDILRKLDEAAQRSVGVFSVIGVSPENEKSLVRRVKDEALFGSVLVDGKGLTFNQYGFRGKLPVAVVIAAGGIVASIQTNITNAAVPVRTCADTLVAMRAYQSAFNIYESMPESWMKREEKILALSLVRMLMGENEAAKQLLDTLSNRPSPPTEMHASLGLLSFLRGADADALARCREAPNSGFANWVAGMVRNRNGECDAASDAFRKAAEGSFMFDWQKGIVLNMAARVAEQGGDSGLSMQLYKEALLAAPMNPKINCNLMTAYWSGGNYPAASAYADTLKTTQVSDKFIRSLLDEFESAMEFSRDGMAQKRLMKTLSKRMGSEKAKRSSAVLPRTVIVYDLDCKICCADLDRLNVAAGSLLRRTFEDIGSLATVKRPEILAAAGLLKIPASDLGTPTHLEKVAHALSVDLMTLGEIGNYKGQYVLNLRVADIVSNGVIAVTSERLSSLDRLAPAIERAASSLMQQIGAHYTGG